MNNPGDIAYLAGLLIQVNLYGEEHNFCRFSKAMILITLGVESEPDNFEEFISIHFPHYNSFINDFTDNFTTLYPQYFNNLHPIFNHAVDTIKRENNYYDCCNY